MRSVAFASLLLPALALAEPRYAPVCPDHSCKSVVQLDDQGKVRAFNSPSGYEPADLQMMFDVDPTLGAGKTVALVDAFGYQELEADLAVYRSQFNLPACTVASGCLTILNSDGQTSPLGSDTDQGWIQETALDVDMVSAACPLCKIVVVQAAAAGVDGLQIGQLIAAKLDVDAISDSWGGAEDPSDPSNEPDYDNAGIGTFVSSGDDGFGGGAAYPATSAFVIAVGGIEIDGSDVDAWADAQSGCSAQIQKQSWAPPAAPCSMRAFADISAFAAPGPGVATYVLGAWSPVGGTSAASPFSAALFTAAGHGDARAPFVYKHADAFTDITMGTSGTCGSILCEGAVGWDGPTGLGTPDQAKLVAIGNVAGAGPTPMIGYPSDGATVSAGFTIEMASTDTAVWTQVQIDGSNVARLATAGMTTAPLTVTDGAHTLTFTSYDEDHNSGSASIDITVGDDMTMGGGGGGGGCCSVGGSGPSSVLLGVVGLLALRRRRQSTSV
jgi:hypothetical protein